MEISNPLPMDRMYTDDGHLVHCKMISLATWNLLTTNNSDTAHGLGASWKNIIAISVTIRNDADTRRFVSPVFGNGLDPNLIVIGCGEISSTTVFLSRRTGSYLQDAAYSSVAFSRGFMYLWYFE
jgi:hypothetical protein